MPVAVMRSAILFACEMQSFASPDKSSTPRWIEPYGAQQRKLTTGCLLLSQWPSETKVKPHMPSSWLSSSSTFSLVLWYCTSSKGPSSFLRSGGAYPGGAYLMVVVMSFTKSAFCASANLPNTPQIDPSKERENDELDLGLLF